MFRQLFLGKTFLLDKENAAQTQDIMALAYFNTAAPTGSWEKQAHYCFNFNI